MFINCPFCKSLVATDPATDLPPERCPRCAARLDELPTDTASSPSPSLYDTGGAPVKPEFDLLEVPTPDTLAAAAAPALPASGLATQIHEAVAPAPIAPIATMLRPRAPGPEAAPEAEPEAPAPAATGDASPLAAEAAPTPAAQPFAPVPATPPTPAELDEAADTDTPGDAETAVQPVADATTGTDAPHATDAADSPVQTTPDPAPATAPAATRALPSFARRRRRGASGFGWKSGAAIAGLALLLVLQLLLADRVNLASDARWRPLLANVCGVFGCSLPPWREPGAFSVLARDVRPHPSTPGVLRVTATFRNDARWSQPWPRVRLTLSDVNGRAVAARDFDAGDYLGEAPAQAELRSGQSASIAMDVLEPAARSVAFDFELH